MLRQATLALLIAPCLAVAQANLPPVDAADIIDPNDGKVLYTIEHEVRSITHPLYARPLVNRNPVQTNRNYRPGYDAGQWAAPHSM